LHICALIHCCLEPLQRYFLDGEDKVGGEFVAALGNEILDQLGAALGDNSFTPSGVISCTQRFYASAFAAGAFFVAAFFGFAVFSANSKPTLPFSNFRCAENGRPFFEMNFGSRSVLPVVINFWTCSFGISAKAF
jgi:hypothetical protein